MASRPALVDRAVSSPGLCATPALDQERVVQPPVRQSCRADVVAGVVVSSFRYVRTPGVHNGYAPSLGGGQRPIGPDGYAAQPSASLSVPRQLLEVDIRRVDRRIVPALGNDVIAGRERLSVTAKRRRLRRRPPSP